jgi:hypothetical protein
VLCQLNLWFGATERQRLATVSQLNTKHNMSDDRQSCCGDVQYSELNIQVTDMRHLTTVRVLRYASLGDFVVVRACTYTNLDSTV